MTDQQNTLPTLTPKKSHALLMPWVAKPHFPAAE